MHVDPTIFPGGEDDKYKYKYKMKRREYCTDTEYCRDAMKPLSKFLSKILPMFCMYVHGRKPTKNQWLYEANIFLF
jgi:hypothetical protein